MALDPLNMANLSTFDLAYVENTAVPSTVHSGTGPETTGFDCETIATQKYWIFLHFVYTVQHVVNFV